MDFDTYAATVAYGPALLAWATGENPAMPPSSSTSPEEQASIAEWVQCGWPREATPSGTLCQEGTEVVAADTITPSICDMFHGGIHVVGDVSDNLASACTCTIEGDLTLTSVSEWPALSSVTGTLLTTSESEMPMLDHIGGSLKVSALMSGTLSLPALTKIEDDLSLHDLRDTVVRMNALTEVGGHVEVSDVDTAHLLAPHLQHIRGELMWTDSTLEQWSDLESLETIGEGFTLRAIDGLHRLEGLERVTLVGTITLDGCADLEGIDAFGSLEHLEGDLTLTGLPQLYHVPGWGALASVAGAVTLRQTALTELAPWPPLITVGALTIEDQPVLDSLVRFDTLTHVTGDVTFRDTPLLEAASIERWLKPTQVDGSVLIE